MAFIVVYDADVLYPNTLRDVLIRIAQLPHLVQAKWTKVGARVIVTRNVRHFPKAKLAPWNIKAKSPDDFVYDQIDIDSRAIWACIQQIVDSRTRRPVTIEDVLGQLERSALVASVAALRMR